MLFFATLQFLTSNLTNDVNQMYIKTFSIIRRDLLVLENALKITGILLNFISQQPLQKTNQNGV